MDRRTFLGSVALAVLAAPLVAAAQQAEKGWRIGVLASAPGDSPLIEAFRQGLRKLGYVEGQNVRFEYRFAAGQNNLLAGLAADLVRDKVDVILTDGNAAVHAAKDATMTIPIGRARKRARLGVCRKEGGMRCCKVLTRLVCDGLMLSLTPAGYG